MFSGSKGGSSSFKQTPDNLRSNDTFEGVLGLCIGPIKGPTRGLKSIKLDGTAIENQTGQQNFPDFIAPFGDGDPLKFPQIVQLKLGAGAASTQVGVSLTNSDGNNPIWATRTLNNVNADFIDLRFIAQQLYRQDAKGIYDATATLEIQLKPTASKTWINPTLGTSTATYQEQGLPVTSAGGSQTRVLVPQTYYDTSGQPIQGKQNYVISGKTNSPSVYELRLGVPNEGAYANTSWDIRARLLERDSYTGGTNNADQEKRSITWESIAAVYGSKMGMDEGWRGVAWLQLYGKASDQLTGVPEITGEYDTKIVSVPVASIFNPDTRQYTAGLWDGSWAKAFTTDPAWIINDAISDGLAGLSLIAQGSYLNKWDALDLSKYCSTLVPDGDGGTEPRFSMNISITEPQKAEDFIRYLSGAVGALAWDQGDGEWRCKVDQLDNPVDIFTLDNIEGEFVYSHTDVDTRYNNIIGQFKNADMDYRQDSVELFDNDSIAMLGRKPTTIALVGCTGRQEAMRRVKLRLRATVNENRIVTFTTNRRGRNVEQLSTILIADGDLGDQAARTTGRMLSISADRKSITVRDPLYIAPGLAYKMWFTIPNPNYAPEQSTQPNTPNWTKPTLAVSRNIVNTAGTVTTLQFDTALPASIDMNLSVALEANGLPTVPVLYRVTNVVIQDDGERIAISAINIDTGKQLASDNVSKQDTVFQDLRGAVPMPLNPISGPLLNMVRVPVQQGFQTNLAVNFQRPPGAFLSGFQIAYRINGGAMKIAVDRLQQSNYEFVNPAPGLYHIEIRTMDRRGGLSNPLIGEITVTQDQLSAGDIKYADNTTVETLKPRDAGATKGATGDDPVGNKTANQIVSDISLNGTNALYATAFATSKGAILDAISQMQGGSALVTQITNLTTKITDPTQNGIQTLNLIGAAQKDASGNYVFVINQNTALGTVGNLLGQTIDGIVAQVAGHEESIKFTKQILSGPNGTEQRGVLSMTDGNVVTGFVNTLTGGKSRFAVLADEFYITSLDSNGIAYNPFTIINGEVTMLDVVVRKLSYSALVPLFGAQYSQLDPAGGFQMLPGGFIIQWGQYRQLIANEDAIEVVFPMPFPTALMSAHATAYITSANHQDRDLWMQVTSDRDKTHQQFQAQATSKDRSIDGFDWIAFGY